MMTIHDIFETYRSEKGKLEVSIEQMKDELGTMIDKIVLYGAGSAGIAFLHYLNDVGINPCYFSDGNPEKWGKICEGLKIIDYREIVDRVGDDALVIVTINTDRKTYCQCFDENLKIGGHAGTIQRLREAGCKNIIDYVHFWNVRQLFEGDKYNLFSVSDVRLMENHYSDLEKVYNLLADDYSKILFLQIIQYRMINPATDVATISEDCRYFEYELFEKSDNQVFVDGGAYNGNSLESFLCQNKHSFGAYYGFEPDPFNYNKLRAKISHLPIQEQNKIQIFPKALFNYKGSARMVELNGPGSFLNEEGEFIVETETIDNIIGNAKVSFIKMNIEGAEIPALQGAKNTIMNFHPYLAIAGYHKTKDLWEVPLCIHEFDKDYKIYLRSYKGPIDFYFWGIQ